MRRVLYVQWGGFMQDCLEWSMQRLEIEYDNLFYYIEGDRWDNDENLAASLHGALDGRTYDTVLSINFCPVISDVCEELRIHYISWVYDSPIRVKRVDAMKNSCNDIWFFDRYECEIRRSQGVVGAHHLPLAVDTMKFSDEGIALENEARRAGQRLITDVHDNPKEWYECDVAFVGCLYQSQYAELTSLLDDYHRGYLEGVVRAQQNLYGGFVIDEMISDSLLGELNRFFIPRLAGGEGISRQQLIEMLGTEVAGRDRRSILAMLQDRYKVNLYSGDSDKALDKVICKGTIDYDTQMPKAFRHAKINLNIAIRLIRTGISLRVLDVLGSGGFLITYPQPEILEHFVDGQDLVIYESLEDLERKVAYYMAHDDERRAIAKHGYEKVREKFTFDDRLRTMFGMK